MLHLNSITFCKDGVGLFCHKILSNPTILGLHLVSLLLAILTQWITYSIQKHSDFSIIIVENRYHIGGLSMIHQYKCTSIFAGGMDSTNGSIIRGTFSECAATVKLGCPGQPSGQGEYNWDQSSIHCYTVTFCKEYILEWNFVQVLATCYIYMYSVSVSRMRHWWYSHWTVLLCL